MQFGTGYESAFSRKYDSIADMAPQSDIEKPIMPPGTITTSEFGQTVSEGGRQGTLIQSATAAIRAGVGTIELSTSMGGGQEPYVGAEAYGKEARQALREMAEVNKVQLVSVHTPTQIGNLSGLTQEGFKDEYRLSGIEEVKKAINFAVDVNRGGAIVVHTGEYQRPISDQEWAKRKNPDGTQMKDQEGNPIYEFVGYQEEPGRAVYYMVDDRDGRIISSVRKNQEVYEPVYITAKDRGLTGKRDPKTGYVFEGDDYVDMNDHYIDETDPDSLFNRVPVWNSEKSNFETVKRNWDYFENKSKKWNKKYPDQEKTTEDMFYKTQMEEQIHQARGMSLYHAQRYEEERRDLEKMRKAKVFYDKLEGATSEEEKWKLKREFSSYALHLVPPDIKLPSEYLKEKIKQYEHHLRHTHESSASADARAETLKDSLRHVKPVSQYAMEQSMKSYAEAGIFAMQQTDSNKLKKDIFVAPENIWPEMGYGAHPEELIELVSNARKEMVHYLTSPQIKDPHGRRDKDGNLIIIKNEWYRPGINKEQAWNEAQQHIKATFDTQHLGMWRKHFLPKHLPGKGRMENKEETDKRFNKWYMEQVEKLEESGIIGHLHVVDSMGSTHAHLPAGQGAFPVIDAIRYLKEKGYTGTMASEGFAEEVYGPGRIITAPWRAMGAPITGGYGIPPVSSARWSDVQHGYFGRTQPPMFIFGAYSPSNEWQLWSEVPME